MASITSRRQSCIACGTQLTEELVQIPDQYPSAVFPEKDADYRAYIDPSSLNLSRCSNDACGLVQLAYIYDFDFIYRHYPYRSGSTATMARILSDVVREAETVVGLDSRDVVLDIGGNDATLLSCLSQSVQYRVNIDPSEGIVPVLDGPDYVHLQTKFTAQAYHSLALPPPKLIFSVAMFYQLDDPVGFARQVEQIMANDSVWCIQMTYLGAMLHDNIYDNIVHEHVAYYSLASLKYVLNAAGLIVCGAKVVKSYGGSLRVYVTKKGGDLASCREVANAEAVDAMELKEGTNSSEALIRFNERIGLLRDFTRELLEHIVDKEGRVWGIGASTKGNMICQFIGANSQFVECILDNSAMKVGRYMIGTDIPIVDERAYLENLAQYVLILPYYYTDFFISLMQNHLALERDIYAIVPLPKPHIRKIRAKSGKIERE
jgi:hypothetical protein